MRKLLGFTLSELMIALAVLGILTATVLPAILGNNPNQNKVMMKKAYYVTAETVSEMINDPALYPEYDSAGTHYVGFDNKSSVNIEGTNYNGNTKFANLFFSLINPRGQVSSKRPFICGGNECLYTKTKDGMEWYIESLNSSNIVAHVFVDVNGDSKPNCFQGAAACAGRNENFDQFRMNIYNDGAITIYDDDVWAQDAITVNSSLSD